MSAAADYQWDVYRAAAAYLAARAGARFADVGCGYPRKVVDLIEPVTRDITLFDQPSMAPLMQRDFARFRFVPVHFEAPPDVRHGPFDCIVCADVIEHLLHPDPLLDFLKRELAAGGRLFLSTPERDALRGRNCLSSPHAEHVREWNFSEFADYLRSRGLGVLEHMRLPTKRLNAVDAIVPRPLRRLWPRRYGACQLAVCKV